MNAPAASGTGSFAFWRALARADPAAAAAEVHRRVAALAPAARRAALAGVTPEADLATDFARAATVAGPLAGVPVFVKDLFPVAGQPLGLGAAFAPVPGPQPRDSHLVARLRTAGAVIAGRTHLHEFAYGLTGENPHWGDVFQPLHPDRFAGGSSSGSAAVVQADVAPLALGTDTGGSIRVPAAFCGLWGVRLAPETPDIADAWPLAPTFDTAGWFCRSGADLASSLDALAPSRPVDRPLRGWHLRLSDLGGGDPGVELATTAALSALAPHAPPAARTALQAAFSGTTEPFAVLQSREAWLHHRPWLDAHRDQYDPEVWARIERGRRWTAAQVEAAQDAFRRLEETWEAVFREVDFLAYPATPVPAPTRSEATAELRGRLLRLTTPASLGRRPALTVPLPLPGGRSTGLQVVTQAPSHLPPLATYASERTSDWVAPFA